MVARLLKGLKIQSKTPLADFLATQLCLAKQRQIVKTAQNRNLGRLAGTAVEIDSTHESYFSLKQKYKRRVAGSCGKIFLFTISPK